MSEQPSLKIEALARLDLRPDEILAVTYGVPGLTVDQCEQVSDYLRNWLADHGQPVAGVLVLPQGSQLAAIRTPQPVTVNIDLGSTGMTAEEREKFARAWDDMYRNPPPFPKQ